MTKHTHILTFGEEESYITHETVGMMLCIVTNKGVYSVNPIEEASKLDLSPLVTEPSKLYSGVGYDAKPDPDGRYRQAEYDAALVKERERMDADVRKAAKAIAAERDAARLQETAAQVVEHSKDSVR